MSGHGEFMSRNYNMRDMKQSWWSRRSRLQKSLILIVGILVAVTVVVTLGFAVYVYLYHGVENMPQSSELRISPSMPRSEDKNTKTLVCTTDTCIHTASTLLKNMDRKVDPCDDFYSYSCNGFVEKTRIPDDKTSVNTFSIITDLLQQIIRDILETPIGPKDARPFVLAKTLYRACMNKDVIEKRGKTPLLDVLAKLGGWPVLDGDNWDEESFTWEESVAKFRAVGYSVDYFLDFSVGIDVKNSSKRVIDFDQASLGLSREYLSHGFTEPLVEGYYNYMVDIAEILGADKERAKKELKESLEFEITLANISLPLEKRRNATALYNPMTVREMNNRYPTVDWQNYINQLLKPHYTVGLDEVVIVNVPEYFADLEGLMKKTPKRVQANYVMWRVAAASVSYLGKDVRQRQMKYITTISGKPERESRWKECVDITSSSLSIAVGTMYVRKHFNEGSKRIATEMVQDIQLEFRHTLEKVGWMDGTTRNSALGKVDAMESHIAYPQEILNDQKLTDHYSGLEMSEDKLMESVLNLTLFGTDSLFRKLRHPVNRTDWVSHSRAAVVNAFYSSIENSIQFPAGILQGTFFSESRPAYMNYGAIGFVIGHEITHGFDDQGRQFDMFGNLVDWWEEETKQKYLAKAKCIIEQYSNYTVEEVGLKLNGVNTQGENIADNGGIKGAYYAYKAWVKRNGEEPRLPGLENFTPQQMFWLSAANTWCSVYRNESMKLRITTGFHAPGRFRVIGPFSNMEEFARDFSCPLGSPMNPEKKCKVW